MKRQATGNIIAFSIDNYDYPDNYRYKNKQNFIVSGCYCTKIAQKLWLNKFSPKVTESPNFKTSIAVDSS